MAILHLGSPSEECISLIKEQDGVPCLHPFKNLVRIIFGLPDVFADHTEKVNPKG